MAKTFHAAAAACHARIASNRGLDVTYRDGGVDIALSDAVPGKVRFVLESTAGVRTTSQQRDWIIRASQLTLDGDDIEPRDGAQILLEIDSGQVEVYEIGPVGDAKHFERMGATGGLIRIHTRRTGVEPEGSE